MSQDSPLLALAPELRNSIYRYSLLSETTVDVTRKTDAMKPPGILATCRQICEEATGIYYSENVFELEAPFTRTLIPFAACWLRAIGPARSRMVTKLQVHLERKSRYESADHSWMVGTPALNSVRSRGKALVETLVGEGLRLGVIQPLAPKAAKTFMDQIAIIWKEGAEQAIGELAAE